MAKVQQHLLRRAAIIALLAQTATAQKFFPDDPIQAVPRPLPVGEVRNRDIDPLYDFLWRSISPNPGPPVPAGGVNTLGEVPDNSWFTNRHGGNPMTKDRLQRGPHEAGPPVPPFTVVGGKEAGITPGFRIRDSAGRLYFVKVDPMSNPEMATASDVIVSRFFYALGYNTPENYIVYTRSADLRLSSTAKIKTEDGRSRPMTLRDLNEMLRKVPHGPDGAIRIMASLAVKGQLVGPFRYDGTRSDDPNDIVAHQNRRDLRGLFVFAAWLNHTDAKAGNSLDAVVEENGTKSIRHYLIDFGSALGSDGDRPKDASAGNEFIFPKPRSVLTKIVTFGLLPARWERTHYPRLHGAGNFDSTHFDPERWKSNYPNPAFLSRLSDDEFWAAKQVMAFSDDDIRAIVATGEFSDPRVEEYLTKTLAERRDKIGRTYFAKVTPLDRFRVQDARLQFEDLAVNYRFRAPREYKFRWFKFDNTLQRAELLVGSNCALLPTEARDAFVGSYFLVVIDPVDEELKSVRVYIRRGEHGYEVVGIERTWPGSNT